MPDKTMPNPECTGKASRKHKARLMVKGGFTHSGSRLVQMYKCTFCQKTKMAKIEPTEATK